MPFLGQYILGKVLAEIAEDVHPDEADAVKVQARPSRRSGSAMWRFAACGVDKRHAGWHSHPRPPANEFCQEPRSARLELERADLVRARSAPLHKVRKAQPVLLGHVWRLAGLEPDRRQTRLM